MADDTNRLNNQGTAPSDIPGGPDPLRDGGTTGKGLPVNLPDDDLLEDDLLDTESADLADADLFDDESDLVPLDEIENLDDDEAEDVTGQDDDNPYQESDEALPDDDEERSIARDNSREGTRFGEI
jgi:hypothetical protein